MSKSQELYEAVRKGSIEAVENFLSEPGIKKHINKMYEQGNETLLSVAVRGGSVGIIDMLLEKGANVDTATPTKTPLHVACYQGDLRVCKCLVGHKADLEKPDETNRTALQWAVKAGHSHVFNFLADHKADLSRIASDGNSVMHDSMQECSSDFIFELLDKDCFQVDAPNNKGETPLFLAAAAGKVDVMRRLITLGADVNVSTKSEETLLHVASRSGHLNVVEFLVETVKMNEKYINKQTGENSVVTINKIKTASVFWTALHFACAFGHVDIVRYLLNQGGDKKMRTRDGLKPVEICKAYRQKHLLPIFEERRVSLMPGEEVPSEEQLRARRKTLPANAHGKSGWKNVF